MRLLLDTCTFLWLISGDPQLPEAILQELETEHNEVWLSTVSNWEIAVKVGIGRLVLPDKPASYVPHQRARHKLGSLPVEEAAIGHLDRLPPYHRDPFDRMLICQAIEGEMTLVTPDPLIRQYPVRTLWS